MNSASLFSGRATDYAKYRPSYPQAAIATILEGLNSQTQVVAADIGAGTGIASRLLADRGVKVIAIEPNAEMRQAAAEHPLVEFREATAEASLLPNKSVELVTSFQAFHWFELTPTLEEFHRILKPSGRLALVWSVWDKEDAFTEALSQLESLSSAPSPKLTSWQTKVGVPPKNPYFQHFRQYQFADRQQLDLPGLIGLVQSQGFIPLSGEKNQRLVEQLQKLYEKWANQKGVSVVYRTSVYLAEPTSIDSNLNPNYGTDILGENERDLD